MSRNGSGVYSKPAGTTAVSGTTIESAKFNSVIDDLVDDANAARPIVAGGTGATTAAGARTNLGLSTGTAGYLFGLTLSNNTTDSTNDIDIASGIAAEQDVSAPTLITLSSGITKRLDGSWAVGTNQGGLDTGSIANTTYHVWLIERSDTGVVDALFSASATSPTMPANYDKKRLIGSIIRSGATILQFVQDGDRFSLLAPVNNVAATNPGTSAVLRTLTTPAGRRLEAILAVAGGANINGQGPGFIYISDPSVTDSAAATNAFSHIISLAASFQIYGGGQVRCFTNTSSQVRSRLQISGSTTELYISTIGWVDRRGRDQ